jgi:hypothetical protein
MTTQGVVVEIKSSLGREDSESRRDCPGEVVRVESESIEGQIKSKNIGDRS